MEPERELIRRIAPFLLPATLLAFAIGAMADGPYAGWSAAIEIAIVSLNFIVHGWSLAWAARISPVVVYGVGLGGFVVRLGVIVLVIALLDRQAWFSLPAFLAALVPATIILLAAEMRLLAGHLQADLWAFPPDEARARR